MEIPKVGQKAPGFDLLTDGDQRLKLTDLKGQWVALYFYPKDDTPGCTKEACGLRDDYAAFEQAGVRILGVSPDSPASHRKFKEKYNLPFTLLSDDGHKLCDRYGVWGAKKFVGKEYMGVLRTTFLIDPEGKIARVFENVKPEGHSQEILSALQASQA
jgi:peroxiredoxin Q/BCP